jgi:predicted DNA-binding transcriptional regulator YafY
MERGRYAQWVPSALIRQWLLLTLLPTRPRRVDTAALEERLRSRGHRVHRRTIQRDLIDLATVFPIIADERTKPYGWRWADGADLVGALFARDPAAGALPPLALRLRVPPEQATSVSLALRSRRETRGEVRVVPVLGASEILAHVEDGDGLRRWLLGFADLAEVVSPPELRRDIAEMAKRAAKLHDGARRDG